MHSDPKPQSHPTVKTLAELFAAGSRRDYGKGEVMVHSDSAGHEIFYIEKGFIKVYSVNNRGEMYVHLIYRRGEIFPISWLIGLKKHNLFFEALSPATLFVLPQTSFQAAIESSILVSNESLKQITKQFMIYVNRLDNLQYKYAQERVIYRLLFLARRFGQIQSDGSCLINAPISQQLIASSINVSRENVSRELERLQRKGFVLYVNKKITIPSLDSLQRQFPGQLGFY